MVATRDVLILALVYSDSFPAESICLSFCSAQRALCESCPVHQVLVFLSLVDASAHLVHETVCS